MTPHLGTPSRLVIAAALAVGLVVVSWRWLPERRRRVDPIYEEFVFDDVVLHEVCGELRCPTLPPTKVDGWGTPIRVKCSGNDYKFWTAGKDRVFGTVDDRRRGCGPNPEAE
jgi:hypothetical protein